MEFKSKIVREKVQLSIQGNILSKYDGAPLLEEVETFIEKGHSLFILDLSKTEFLNSEGLNVLLKILTRTRTVGGEVVVCRISKSLENLFIITKLTHIFTVKDSIKSADEYLSNKFGAMTAS